MNINKDIISVVLVIIFLWLIVRILTSNSEGFDAKSVEFVPVGHDRYGIRGDYLRSSDIAKNYIGTNRHLAVHPTGNIMWESDLPPHKEGIPKCQQVPCPQNQNDADYLDTCWKCGSAHPGPLKIPDIHPHVPN
jgi:hypothetical protein